MADKEHLAKLKEGVEAWNKWRDDYPQEKIDLTEADLEGAYLERAELQNANLSRANLENAILIEANLENARLIEANLNKAQLFRANLKEVDLSRVDLKGAELVQANLENAKLSMAHLEHSNLSGAYLENADLSMANLENVNLSGAHLEEANLMGANLENADLSDAHLEKATLIKANLENAILLRAHLESSELFRVNLKKSTLISAHLENSQLYEACLENANLRSANLENANLREARLENADLRGASGYCFDGTFIRGSNTSSGSTEPWLVLRRNYTGASLLIFLFLLSFFLLPYIAKTFWWVGVNNSQSMVGQAIEERRTELQETLSTDPLELVHLTEQLESLSDRERLEVLVLAQATDYLDKWRLDWREWSAWQLLLGVDKGWTYLLLALLILFYYACRILLTLSVTPLRDQEDLVGQSPLYRPRKTLRERLEIEKHMISKAKIFRAWITEWWLSIIWLRKLHRLATGLLYVALASGLYHLLDWLSRPVWLPQ